MLISLNTYNSSGYLKYVEKLRRWRWNEMLRKILFHSQDTQVPWIISDFHFVIYCISPPWISFTNITILFLFVQYSRFYCTDGHLNVLFALGVQWSVPYPDILYHLYCLFIGKSCLELGQRNYIYMTLQFPT